MWRNVYRHFPTRADLLVAVYRHQVEAGAEAGPALLADSLSRRVALQRWTGFFMDFLVTKHGLPEALQHESARTDALLRYFVHRLVRVCDALLAEATRGRQGVRVRAYPLMRAVGNLYRGRDPW